MAGRDPLLQGGTCDRAREWVSRRLDGELLPLEAELPTGTSRRALTVACSKTTRWATDVRPRAAGAAVASRHAAGARARAAHRPAATAVAAAAFAAGALVGALVERPSSCRRRRPARPRPASSRTT